MKGLFKVKDKSLKQTRKIYQGADSCNQSYVTETVRHVEISLNVHYMHSSKQNLIKRILIDQIIY